MRLLSGRCRVGHSYDERLWRGVRRCAIVAVIATSASIAASGTALASPAFEPSSLSCPAASFCVVVGLPESIGPAPRSTPKGYVATFNGRSWSKLKVLERGADLSAVSCPSRSFCLAVDDHGRSLTFNGHKWSAASSFARGSELESVSCTSSSFCVAVGVDKSGSGDAWTYNGHDWGNAVTVEPGIGVSGPGRFGSVSCSSSSFCVTVGQDGQGEARAWPYNGHQWGTPSDLGLGRPSAVSCRGSAFCLGVGFGAANNPVEGDIYLYAGTTWTARTKSKALELVSVSCPSTSFCTAVDAPGQAFTYDGHRWSKPTSIDHNTVDVGAGYIDGVTNVSCASRSLCVAVDYDGHAMIYNGRRWSVPRGIG